MKKFITLTSATVAAVALAGAALPAFADSVSATQYNSTATVSFTAPDGNTPQSVTNPEAAGQTSTAQGTAGALAIDYASNLDFGSHTISASDATYYASADSTAFSGTNVADFVEMHDLRGLGSGNNWTLSVTQQGQFANGSSTMTGAQLSFSSATAKNANGGSYVPTATASFTLTPGTAQNIMTGDGTVGQFLTSYGAAADYKGNETGAPISLSVPSGSAQTGSYTSTLVWNLTADPA